MYVPPAFSLSEAGALDLAETLGFGAFVSLGPSGLEATHLPFVLDRGEGRVVAHAARANSQFTLGETPALLIVQGPYAYVSPSFYPSKAEHGRVVPTWNYEAVHLAGVLSVAPGGEDARPLLEDLTRRREAARPVPWSLEDAPQEYIAGMLEGVVRLELAIRSVQGVQKLSQNRSGPDRAGVKAGLQLSGSEMERTLAGRMDA